MFLERAARVPAISLTDRGLRFSRPPGPIAQQADFVVVMPLRNQSQHLPAAFGSAVAQKFTPGNVVVLDDDEWDDDHLRQCEMGSREVHADVVLPGLRVVKDGVELPRAPLLSISRGDFLAGNPGWQGSNTFVKSRALERAGGFSDGLPSTNDRDLAVRLLGLPDLTVAFTGRMTASWHVRSHGEALSRAGSPEKQAGLLQFFALHGNLMSPEVKTRCRTRARELFGIDVP